MMWTIAPVESLIEGEPRSEQEEILYHNGVMISAVREASGGYRVRRILSTEPNDYLSAELMPNHILWG